jgi:hypothetical protein
MPVGCGTHTAAIYDRDGALVTAADVLVSVEWTRVLDDMSQAQIVIQPAAADCCARLDEIRSWRHRLIIWRDGRLVWEGPVLQLRWSLGGLVVQAGDVLAWMDRRVPHQDREFTDVDLADIGAWLIADAFAPDDPGHSVEIVAPSGVAGDREYLRDEGQSGDHLRDLAKTGLDFTAVGSRIVLLPEDHTASIGSLTEDDLPDGLTVVEDGVSLATRWVVHGRDEVVGEAGGIDSYYGLLERVADESSILDARSARAAARSRLRANLPAPVWIDSSRVTLSSNAAVDVPGLVPGWCVDVTTTRTCRTIAQRLKLMSVHVTEDDSGEAVSVQLAPAGA